MNEHSKNFEIVKDFYVRGLWERKRLVDAVSKGWITKEEYKEVTGKEVEYE